MKSQEDAFGQMMWAFYKGRNIFEVFERSDGFIYVDSSKNYFSEYEDWALVQKKVFVGCFFWL